MAGSGGPTGARPHGKGRSDRLWVARLGLALLLLLALPLAGCLAPPAPAYDRECLSSLSLPETLPAIETRTGETGRMEIQDDSGVWTPVGNLSRIVPTSHDLVELLFLMGHAERVAAVPNWIDHPPGEHPAGIEGLPRLGKPHNIPAEDVRAVDPTIVLDKPSPLQPIDLAPPLRGAGLDVVVIEDQENLHTLARTYAFVATVLEVVDPQAPDKAQALWEEFVTDLSETHARLVAHFTTTGAHCPRTIYMFPANLAAGDGTAAGLVLELAGAQNLATQAGLQGYRTLSREALLEGDPERVVGTTTGGLPSPKSPRWEPTLAGESGEAAFLAVDPAITGLTGPRLGEGVRLIAEWLHPVAFGLIESDVQRSQETHDDGSLTVELDATGSRAEDGALRYRYLPGDASEAQENPDGRFTHTYTVGTNTTAHLLMIDPQGRIHTHTERIVS